MQPTPDHPVHVDALPNPERPANGSGAAPSGPNIPDLIQRSQEAFRRELPQLLQNKKRFRQWVAYHGDERIGFAATDIDLYETCYRRGLEDGEFVVRYIVPEMPKELDLTPLSEV